MSLQNGALTKVYKASAVWSLRTSVASSHCPLLPHLLSLTLLFIVQLSAQKPQYMGERGVQWFGAWPLQPNCLVSNPSPGPDWPGLRQVSVSKPITGQGDGTPSPVPWDPGMKSVLLTAWWSESRGEMIHQSKSRTAALRRESRCRNKNCHSIVMPCFPEFDRSFKSPVYELLLSFFLFGE